MIGLILSLFSVNVITSKKLTQLFIQNLCITDMALAVFQLARARLRPVVLARTKSSISGARLVSSSPNAPDYYNILGVSKTATQPEIKEAFLKLADQYDHFLDDKSERFMLIMEAYETLRLKESREKYDLMGKANTDLVGDSAKKTFLVRGTGEEAGAFGEEGDNTTEEDLTMKEKRERDIKNQQRGLFVAAWSLFMLISVPKCFVWLIGDPGFRLSDWAVRDR